MQFARGRLILRGTIGRHRRRVRTRRRTNRCRQYDYENNRSFSHWCRNPRGQSTLADSVSAILLTAARRWKAKEFDRAECFLVELDRIGRAADDQVWCY